MLCLFLTFLFCHHISIIELYCTDTVTYVKRRERQTPPLDGSEISSHLSLYLTATLLLSPSHECWLRRTKKMMFQQLGAEPFWERICLLWRSGRYYQKSKSRKHLCPGWSSLLLRVESLIDDVKVNGGSHEVHQASTHLPNLQSRHGNFSWASVEFSKFKPWGELEKGS